MFFSDSMSKVSVKGANLTVKTSKHLWAPACWAWGKCFCISCWLPIQWLLSCPLPQSPDIVQATAFLSPPSTSASERSPDVCMLGQGTVREGWGAHVCSKPVILIPFPLPYKDCLKSEHVNNLPEQMWGKIHCRTYENGFFALKRRHQEESPPSTG